MTDIIRAKQLLAQYTDAVHLVMPALRERRRAA